MRHDGRTVGAGRHAIVYSRCGNGSSSPVSPPNASAVRERERLRLIGTERAAG